MCYHVYVDEGGLPAAEPYKLLLRSARQACSLTSSDGARDLHGIRLDYWALDFT